MSSFQTLINSFDSDNSKRGTEFERFVKWFLVHDPEWSTRVDKVWLWDDWPENWGRDCGIDFIFKEKIQEKYGLFRLNVMILIMQ